MRARVRDMKYLTVSPQSLRSMVDDILKDEAPSKEMNSENLDRIRVHRMDFGEGARQKYADLTKTDVIQVPDIN